MSDWFDYRRRNLRLTRHDIIMCRWNETTRLRPSAPGHLLPYVNLFPDLSVISLAHEEDPPKYKVNWMKEGF